jgi:hypothetical protein
MLPSMHNHSNLTPSNWRVLRCEHHLEAGHCSTDGLLVEPEVARNLLLETVRPKDRPPSRLAARYAGPV